MARNQLADATTLMAAAGRAGALGAVVEAVGPRVIRGRSGIYLSNCCEYLGNYYEYLGNYCEYLGNCCEYLGNYCEYLGMVR